MNIRKMEGKDLKEIEDMMKAEGINDNLDFMNSSNTIVLEDNGINGFFNFKFEHGLPSLRHFCFRKDCRKLEHIRLLLNFYKFMVKKMGFSKTIVNSNKAYLDKLVQYYFKVKPYGNNENVNFYLAEV